MSPLPPEFTDPSVLAILNSLSDGVTLAAPNGRIVFSNRAADEILGTGATHEHPDQWADHYGVFLPENGTPFPTNGYPLVRALAGEETRDVEMLIRNPRIPDGALVSVSGRPLLDSGGRQVGAVVVFRDITTLRRTEQELRDTIVRLDDAQRAREEYASFIVHDLKNPLAAILAVCGLVKGQELPDELREDMDAVHEAATRIHHMVMDLLDIHLAEDGALELEAAPLPLSALFRELYASMAPRLRSTRQRLEIGETASSLTAVADRELLLRVLVNLVDNCLKYGPRDGTIRVGARPAPDGRVLVSVEDEGPGIPEHLRESIFGRYARIERVGARSATSRGIGLRFCKVVVEAHGGRIWAEDAEPVGARFCVELAVPDRA